MFRCRVKTEAKEETSPVEPDKMSAGEAALTGFGEGASFGLAPIAAELAIVLTASLFI